MYLFVISHPGESASETKLGAPLSPSLCRPADSTVLALRDFSVSQDMLCETGSIWRGIDLPTISERPPQTFLW